MSRSVLALLLVLFAMCAVRGPGSFAGQAEGAYVDSLGYNDLRKRQADLGDRLVRDAGILVGSALDETATGGTGEEVFGRLEANYQRYRELFSPDRRNPSLAVTSRYDLLATLKLGIFDRQPFMNAILHALGVEEVVTLDYDIDTSSADTVRVTVYWGSGVKDGAGALRFDEGDLVLYVTRNRVSLLPKGEGR